MSIGSFLARIGLTDAHVPKKLCSLVLSLALVLSLMPGVAWADEGAPAAPVTTETTSVVEDPSVKMPAASVPEAPVSPSPGSDQSTPAEGSVSSSSTEQKDVPSALPAPNPEPKKEEAPDVGTEASAEPPAALASEVAYELTSVKLASSGQGMQVGNVITPTAQVKGSASTPADAQVTYTWWVREGQEDAFRVLDEGVASDGALTIAESLLGKYIKVSANALVANNNPESAAFVVVAAGDYDLLRVTTSPASGDLFTGATITASVQARNLTSVSFGDDVTRKIALSWLVADEKDGAYTALKGADASALVIPAEAAGKYLKVVATSGSSSVELTASAVVLNSDTLEAAAKKLEGASFRPDPTYGESANINKVVEAKLAELGYADITVSTKSATARQQDNSATVGVSTADNDTNGDVTFFFMDPDNASSSYMSYTQVRQFDFVFTLSRGNETREYAPRNPGLIPWDIEKTTALLEAKAASITLGLAAGDVSTAVTTNFTLPYKIKNESGANKSWSSVVWVSSDPSSVAVSGPGWSDYSAKVVRTAANQAVTLTAKIEMISSGGPDVEVLKDVEITVKGDPDKVAAEKTALTKKVEAGFVESNILSAQAGALVDLQAVSGDLIFPRPSTLGVDGKYYEVKYSASSDAVEVNGYAGKVFRPLPGQPKTTLDITLTVTDKTNAEITASKTLSLALLPLNQADIDSSVLLMQAAKTHYFEGLAEGQTSGNVTSDLHAFQKVTYNKTQGLTWLYDSVSAGLAGSGIVPVDLEGSDAMGSVDWRLFRSSDPSLVSHEDLKVTPSKFNTQVTVSSCLESEEYARYANRYPGNEAFQKLAQQNVSTTFTVQGSSGQESPEVTATCSVLGVDRTGAGQTWAAAQPYTLKNGATAADVSEALFKATGLIADCGIGPWGWALNTLTSPFDAGLKLGWNTFPNKGWSYYVNGKDPGVGAGSYVVQPGDSIIWRYGSWTDPAPTDQLSVSCSVVGVDAAGAFQTWAAVAPYEMTAGTKASDLSEKMFAALGMKYDSRVGAYGWNLNTITSPYDPSVTLGWDQATGRYWQLFINGEYAQTGAGGYTLQAGDVVTWCYGSDGTLPGQVGATCEVVGADAAGNTQAWATPATYKMTEGATAADVSQQMFMRTKLKTAIDTTYGWYLSSITSPYNSALTLGWNQSSGKYWRLFINGKPSLSFASEYRVKSGDVISWYYSSESEGSLPDNSVVIKPDASRPSYDSSWSGFGSGAVVNRPTPTESAEMSWSYRYAESATGVSDPLIINGDLYLVVAGELQKLDAKTGTLKAKTNIGGSISYLCRPVYSAGILIVPTDGGGLAAFTADALICVWKVKAQSVGTEGSAYQALSSLTVNGDRVYAAFTAVGAGGIGVRGVLVCVDTVTGTILWEKPTGEGSTSSPAGYYWAGAVASGSDIIIGDESGTLSLIDGSSGALKSSVSLGASCRAGVVALPNRSRQGSVSEYVATTTDGTLHKIARRGNTLSLESSVSFAKKSTSTPVVSGGNVFVCGLDDGGYGTLSVITAEGMSVERTVRGGKGEAQSAPLVSVQGDGTYAYFTCNGLPGSVYGYRLGDTSAYVLFTPPADQQQFCAASIVADEWGNLYYTNDSGSLFALSGKAGVRVVFESNGGSFVSPCYVAQKTAVVRPSDPTRTGYVFEGWYSDQACTRLWDFATPVEEALTLYAKWTTVEGSNPGQGGSGNPGTGEETPGIVQSPQAGGLATQTILKQQNPIATVGEKAADAPSPSVQKAAKEQLYAGTAAESGAASSNGDSSLSLNPWAVGGLVLGVGGLLSAAVLGLRMRRRSVAALVTPHSTGASSGEPPATSEGSK